MPTNSDLSPQERLALMARLNALPDPSFKMLVFALNPPAGILPSDLAAQGDRVFTLLNWVEGVTGPGLGVLRDLLDLMGGSPLIAKNTKLTTADWSTLFQCFSPYLCAELQSAFLKAFFDAYQQRFWQMRPDHPPLGRLEHIQDMLASYDNPLLAVRFVERVCAALQHPDAPHPCDLAALKQWRDGIAEKFKVPPPPPPPDNNPIRHAYLLITLEPLNDSQVIAYPELRLTGQEKPISFSPVKATVDDLADSISQWIDLAEEAMDSEDGLDSEVILELFLPKRYLLSDYDVATQWQVSDSPEEEPMALASYRRLVVRSADRVLIRKETKRRQIQQRLCQNWQRLQTCVQNNSVCGDFHRQLNSPGEPGALKVLLTDKPGLKFLAPWPTETAQQRWLMNDVIDSAVPIALWSPEIGDGDAAALEAQVDALLGGCQPTSFARLAHLWRSQRIALPAAKPIRLLCDCPDRLPLCLPETGDAAALVTPA